MTLAQRRRLRTALHAIRDLRARLDAIEAVLKPPVPVPCDMPAATREALNEAVSILWLGDNSDYGTALHTIVRLLWPGADTSDINALYRTLNPKKEGPDA